MAGGKFAQALFSPCRAIPVPPHNTGMARPYGKAPKQKSTTTKKRTPASTDADKFHILDKDNLPLAIPDAQQGLYQLAKYLEAHPNLIVAKLDVYARFRDEHGRPVRIGKDGINIYPYQSAADEHGA
jgi:hypothetical protein